MADDGTGKVRYTSLVSGSKLAEMFQRGRASTVPQAGGETAPSEVVTVQGTGFEGAYDQAGVLFDDFAYEAS